MAGLCDFIELFAALQKLRIFLRLRMKSSAFSSSFTTTLTLLAMKISCFCKKRFRRKTPIFHMTSILALTCILHMSEAECKVEFRFDKKGLPVLAEVLQIPP